MKRHQKTFAQEDLIRAGFHEHWKCTICYGVKKELLCGRAPKCTKCDKHMAPVNRDLRMN